MTGEHVGQVLEQPQRREVLHAAAAPVLDVELAGVLVAAGPQGGGELLDIGGDETGADMAPQPLRREGDLGLGSGRLGDQPRVLDGGRRATSGQRNVAAHHLGRLTVALGHDLAGVKECRVELGGNLALEPAGVERLHPADGGATLEHRLPQGFDAGAKGGDGSKPGNDDAPRHEGSSLPKV